MLVVLNSAAAGRRPPRVGNLVALAFAGALAALARPADAQELGWAPEKTWVVVVGVLEWKASELYPGFPKENRRDAELAEHFRRRGVPAGQVVFLEDRAATKRRIDDTLADLLPKTKPGDLLVLYYAGHGGRHEGATYFANYDITADTAATGWSTTSIFAALERDFRGARVLLAADCCHSGALAVEAAKHRGRVAYAALASVHAHGASTGNWTFTECLLRGLRGDPAVDLNRDGRVLLSELAQHAEDEMAEVEGQLAVFAAVNGFDPATTLALTDAKLGRDVRGDAVLGPAPRGERVEVEWQGSWWPAFVLKTEGERKFIHYAGYGAEWDEWVGPERVRAHKVVTLAAGTAVEVEWNGDWWAAKVLEAKKGLHYIRYDGYGAEWDEWVGPRRLRVAPRVAPPKTND